MRIASINDYRPALVVGDRAIDLTPLLPELLGLSQRDRTLHVITHFDRLKPHLRQAEQLPGVPLSSVTLRAPVPRPSKILACVGNYKEGLEYQGMLLDMFLKSPDSVIGPGETVVLPDRELDAVDHEAELAVVIGSRVHGNLSDAEAMAAVFGYTCVVDVSARGFGEISFLRKSPDTFCPMGPWIVTRDEIKDEQNLSIKLSVDAELRQDFNTSDMDYPVCELIKWAAQILTLNPGDVIATGTNHQGIGRIQDGETVELSIQGIGSLVVHVRDPRKRSWPKGIDHRIGEAAKRWRIGDRKIFTVTK
jgi:2-keto-4-pentenoate hydratase/2-oxohepta-3-ene-1,7-dioic acid hydratase in catechol pathway